MNLKKLNKYTEYKLEKELKEKVFIEKREGVNTLEELLNDRDARRIRVLISEGDELYPGINGTVINSEVIPLRPINEIMSENTNLLVRGEDFDIDQVRDIENSLNSRLVGLRRRNRGMSREDLINFMAEMQLQDEAEGNSEQ